jgi:hypothetical protein
MMATAVAENCKNSPAVSVARSGVKGKPLLSEGWALRQPEFCGDRTEE